MRHPHVAGSQRRFAVERGTVAGAFHGAPNLEVHQVLRLGTQRVDAADEAAFVDIDGKLHNARPSGVGTDSLGRLRIPRQRHVERRRRVERALAQRRVFGQQLPNPTVQGLGAAMLLEHQEPVAEFQHRLGHFLVVGVALALDDVHHLDQRPLAIGEAVDAGGVHATVLEARVGAEGGVGTVATTGVEGREAFVSIGRGETAQSAHPGRVIPAKMRLRQACRVLVERPCREDVVVRHVPVGQREDARQQLWMTAAVAPQQDAVGVFVAAVGFLDVAFLGQQVRFAVDDLHLAGVVQAVVDAGDVQGAVVGTERADGVANPGQRIAKHQQGPHQRRVVAVGAPLDGIDGRLDDVDGLYMLRQGGSLHGGFHGCALGRRQLLDVAGGKRGQARCQEQRGRQFGPILRHHAPHPAPHRQQWLGFAAFGQVPQCLFAVSG